jgi:heme-degrading monooxygenase HmoA
VGIVEITTFELAPAVTEETFLAADRRVQTEVVPNRPGFLRRTTARRGGHVVVVALWYSEGDAVAFETWANGQPVQAAFEALADARTRQVSRYETLD